MTSTGLPANGDPGNEQAREPTGEEVSVVYNWILHLSLLGADQVHYTIQGNAAVGPAGVQDGRDDVVVE